LGLNKASPSDTDQVSIPCPESCSLFLSFARKAVRIEQEEKMNVQLTKSDLQLIADVLRSVLDGTQSRYREGDYGDPRHRQRIEYFLKSHEDILPKSREQVREGED